MCPRHICKCCGHSSALNEDQEILNNRNISEGIEKQKQNQTKNALKKCEQIPTNSLNSFINIQKN